MTHLHSLTEFGNGLVFGTMLGVCLALAAVAIAGCRDWGRE